MKMDEGTLIKSLLDQLLPTKSRKGCPKKKKFTISRDEVRTLCKTVECRFLADPTLLDLKAPIKICGDIHGQYHDLVRIFKKNGAPHRTKYLFLGDLVDRGQHSLEVVCLLFALKAKYPDTFFIIRGNHEHHNTNRIWGFHTEIQRRYQDPLCATYIFSRINKAFSHIPLAAVIKANTRRIFCCHGGLSPHLKKLSDIKKIKRPVGLVGLVRDLLWSDPDSDEEVSDYEEMNDPDNNSKHRGIGYLFGRKAVKRFLSCNSLHLVVRAHQMKMRGYHWLFPEKTYPYKGMLVTVFSAPDYERFKNRGAVMTISAGGDVGFQTLGKDK